MSREAAIGLLENLISGVPVPDLKVQVHENIKDIVACLEDDELLDALEEKGSSDNLSQMAEFFELLSKLSSDDGETFEQEDEQLTEYEKSLAGVGRTFVEVLSSIREFDVLGPLRPLKAADGRIVQITAERPDALAAGAIGFELAGRGLSPSMLLGAARATALYIERERLLEDESGTWIWVSKERGLVPAELEERKSIPHWDVVEEIRAYSKCPDNTKDAVHQWTAATADKVPYLFPGFVAETVWDECFVQPTTRKFGSLAARLAEAETADDGLSWNARELIEKFLEQQGIVGPVVYN